MHELAASQNLIDFLLQRKSIVFREVPILCSVPPRPNPASVVLGNSKLVQVEKQYMKDDIEFIDLGRLLLINLSTCIFMSFETFFHETSQVRFRQVRFAKYYLQSLNETDVFYCDNGIKHSNEIALEPPPPPCP